MLSNKILFHVSVYYNQRHKYKRRREKDEQIKEKIEKYVEMK